MALPVDYQTGTVTGRYVDSLGNPVRGSISFTPAAGRLVSAATNTIILAATLTRTLNDNGEFTVELPATDDPDIVPTGFTYRVKEDVPGGSTYSIDMPAGSITDLSQVSLLESSSSGTVIRPPGGSGGVTLGETSVTAYRGDRGKVAFDHTLVVAGNPHGVTKAMVGLGSVDNTTDAAKPVSTAAATALAAKADLVGGLLSTTQLPVLAITDTFPVDSQAAMLALTAQRGDVAIRSDQKTNYILAAEPASTLANWTALQTPTDLVQSVNGQTGVVVLGKADVGLGSVDNTTDAAKPISTAQAAALAGKVNTTDASVTNARTPTLHAATHATGGTDPVTLAKAQVGLGSVDNTADAAKPVSTAQQTALNSKADLVSGLVPSSQLPAYVDDVLEYANLAGFPATGTAGLIYVALDTNKTFRWSGSAYVEISASIVIGTAAGTAADASTVALLTGAQTIAGVKTFTAEPVSPTSRTTGNTGANTSPVTLTGANATGAPASGAHVKGEVAGDDTGKLWYCTVAGTPGTWVQIGSAATDIDVQVFQTAGSFTWTKPAWVVASSRVEMFVVGGGGGGGGGHRGATATLKFGGGAGSSGGASRAEFSAGDLPATCSVVVGAAGTAGLSDKTAGGAAGAGGGAGGNSSVSATAGSAPYLQGNGGQAGGGGTASAAGSNGGTGFGFGGGLFSGAAGGAGGAAGGAGVDGAPGGYTSGGGGGAGVTAGNVAAAGGAGIVPTVRVGGANAAGGAATGANGANSIAPPIAGWLATATGAGGGGSANALTVGNGGAGSSGAGGGGGAAGTAGTGAVGGNGGAGGAGRIVIVTQR